MLGRKWTLIALSPHTQTAVRPNPNLREMWRDTTGGNEIDTHKSSPERGISYRGRRISVHAMSAPPRSDRRLQCDNSILPSRWTSSENVCRLFWLFFLFSLISFQAPSPASSSARDEKRQRSRRINVGKLNKQLDYINQFITFLGGFGLRIGTGTGKDGKESPWLGLDYLIL